MLNKYCHVLLVVLLAVLSSRAIAQEPSGLSTLFTTAQERLIINANRYKVDRKPVPRAVTQTTGQETLAVRELIKEEIKVSYKISGISINFDGSDTAWVNGQSFENGATMDDGSTITINNNTAIKSISIKTPDGKRHTGTSGDVLEITYLRAIEE